MLEGYWSGDKLIGDFLMVKESGDCFLGRIVNMNFEGFVIKFDYIKKLSTRKEIS